MNGMEAHLDPKQFIRIHRSAIVQANRITELVSVDNREFIVRLSNGTELTASRTYSDRLQRWL
jgi:two-component system LytT family response regulator